jgi:hypothetical protein
MLCLHFKSGLLCLFFKSGEFLRNKRRIYAKTSLSIMGCFPLLRSWHKNFHVIHLLEWVCLDL